MNPIITQSLMEAVYPAEETGKLAVRQVPVPKPGPGEVLIKILAAPINPSDMARINNIPDTVQRSEFALGLEGSGIVVDHGKGILPALRKGKRVACAITNDNSGTWAEYMVTSATSCIPLPHSISDEQGSMLLVNPLTALAFFDIIQRNGHKAVINTAAASSLGRMIQVLGDARGIPVIHIIRTENHRKLLTGRGLKYVLNSSENDFEDKLHDLAHQLKASLALDAVGGVSTQQLIKAIPHGGEVIVYGNLSGEDPQTDHRSLIIYDKSVSGFYLTNWLKQNGIIYMLRTISKAKKLLSRTVSVPVHQRFALKQAQQALDMYTGNMTAGKVLLLPSLSSPESGI